MHITPPLDYIGLQNLGTFNFDSKRLLGDSLAQKSGIEIKRKSNGSFTINGALRKFNSVKNFEGFKNQLIQDITGQLEDYKKLTQLGLSTACLEIEIETNGTAIEKNNHQIRFLLEVFTMKIDKEKQGKDVYWELESMKRQLLSENHPELLDNKISSLVDKVNEGNIEQIQKEIFDKHISGLGIFSKCLHRGLTIQHGEGCEQTGLDFFGGNGIFIVTKNNYESIPLMGGGDLTEEEMKVIIREYFKRAYKTTTRNSATLLPVLGDGMNCYKLLYKAMCKVPRLSRKCWDLPFVVRFRGALKNLKK